MALSDKELKEIAYLARININDELLPSLKGELEKILNLFNKLNSVDTTEIEAMSHPLNLSQPTRPDEITEEDQREKLQETAPSVKSGLFLVPKVIEGDS
ncbi:MAG: Asp-tRNA(Asn)/Glu-tRNA(Gln) amidotransferase GatCAB subunit C [Gammaproteobacteria bacterium]|jgi:aspartyl-tRNA(Asn)/glutamyl-tRNA(Gln) amidotransferase subunit C|nr:Asp-tRNA(Asn)/Glu-tRNA(Gln) amidotransferase GatCAB subunit C [Gammaproteobacteria bacterium]HJM59128.1 Asp-tRNA(Asn)/Glu-tRNA(Gln) amidotransferase subunit GatC [SAR86 cluster bacterium]|tara:strand:- start:3112 stop:3408 length:297 start_codon:yes stop_codon:yes gene_type:complete